MKLITISLWSFSPHLTSVISGYFYFSALLPECLYSVVMTDFTAKVTHLLSLGETLLAKEFMICRSRQIEENLGIPLSKTY